MGNKERKNKKMSGCFPPHCRELKKGKEKLVHPFSSSFDRKF